MSDAGKCLDVMDDLSFWLDETEIIITTSPNYTDEQSLRDALEKVKVSKPFTHAVFSLFEAMWSQ
mgnify:FL=1